MVFVVVVLLRLIVLFELEWGKKSKANLRSVTHDLLICVFFFKYLYSLDMKKIECYTNERTKKNSDS